MSYAAAARSGGPAIQPRPDQALLTRPPTDAPPFAVDDTHKVVVAPSDFKSNPHTVTSEAAHALPVQPSRRGDDRNKKAAPKGSHAKRAAHDWWHSVLDVVVRPGVAGGLIGLVNIGALAALGYTFFTTPALRRDVRAICGTAVGAAALLGAEGALAAAYRKTEAGQAEEQRARSEGAAMYRQTKEIVSRPDFVEGAIGVLNLSIIGAVGYFSYKNWTVPQWDRRIVSATVVGIAAVSVGEGYIWNAYRRDKHH